MGAWDEQPLGNDEAQEWVDNSIIRPMVDAIIAALGRFLADQTDDLKKFEAEAAVALLIDLADPNKHPKYVPLDGRYMASYLGVWDQAITAVRLLISQEEWLAQWGNPEKKAAVLEQLLADVKRAAETTARTRSDKYS